MRGPGGQVGLIESPWPWRAKGLILCDVMSLLFRSKTIVISFLVGAGIVASLAFAAGYSHRSAYRYLNVFQEVWALTNANYVEPVDETTLQRGVYEGMLSSLDVASAYLSPGQESLVRAKRGPARSGMEVLPSGGVPVVVRVDPDGPAEGAGLIRGDQIWEIDGVHVRNLAWPILTRMLSGPAGTELDLVVFGGRNFKLRKLSLKLAVPGQRGFSLETLDDRVIHLRMRDLDLVASEDLRHHLDAEVELHPDAVLLVDLRGVVGLDPAVLARLSGALLPGGPLLKLTTRQGESSAVSGSESAELSLPSPLYVLVDAATAGTAEALAYLLTEREGARSCGRKTFGLGSVPEIIQLKSGGSILLTTKEMRTVSGTSWSGEGLVPEKEIPLRSDFTEDDDEEAPRDYLLDQALHWILSVS